MRRSIHSLLLALVVAGSLPLPLSAQSRYGIFADPAPYSSAFPNRYAPGSTVTLRLGAEPLSDGTLQWLHDDVPIPGANGASLTLVDLTADDSGNYRLRNTVGDTVHTSKNTLTLNVLPFPKSPEDPGFHFDPPGNVLDYSNAVLSVADSLLVRITLLDPPFTFTYRRVAGDGSIDPAFALSPTAGDVLASFADGGLLTSRPPYRTDRDGNRVHFELPAEFDVEQPLDAAAVANNGSFYLAQGGTFIRFLPDGTVDPTFSFDEPLETKISRLRFDREGRLYITGQRRQPLPAAWPNHWLVCYRLNPDGSVDPTFARQEAFPLITGSLTVEPLADGRLLYHSRYHGYRTWRLLDESGSALPGWSSSVFTERPILLHRETGSVYVFDTFDRLSRYLITDTGLERDPTFYPGPSSASITPLAITPDGKMYVSGSVSPQTDTSVRKLARILTDMSHPTDFAPQVTLSPSTFFPTGGSTVSFFTQAQGEPPFTYTWLPLDGQTLPPEFTGSSPTLPAMSQDQLGRYQVRIANAHGSSLSNVVDLAIDANERPLLANLSARAASGPGEAAMITGVTIEKPGLLPAAFLYRGVGPGLADFQVHDVLPNPALDLHGPDGTLLANNDNWGDDWQDQPTAEQVRNFGQFVGAFPLREQSLDAALVHITDSGQFTVRLFDQLGRPGNGLLEVYRVPALHSGFNDGFLTNLSLRAQTGTGDATATAGFVIEDPLDFGRSARILLRASGPGLADKGITQPLPDPVLYLHNAAGEVIRVVDDWGEDEDPTSLIATMAQVGAFELAEGSADAAVVLDLPAGVYTLTATGKGDDTGIVLLEIYLVQ